MLPELGENITAGDVVRVLVSPGDTVTKDQPILELETDKATIEVPSTVSGTVKDVKVKQGEKIKVGQVVLTVDDGGGAAAPAKSAQEEKPKPQPTGAPEEGGLSQQMPEARSTPAAATSDASAAARAADDRESGKVEAEAKPKRGEVVDIRGGARSAPAPQPAPQAEAEAEGPPPPAAPSVRRLARELGVDIRRVTGSGPSGRISYEDVQTFVKSALSGGGGMGAAAPARALPDFSKWGEVERKPMSNIRRKTAEHLASAWATIPHVTQHDKADITVLDGLRKQYSPQAEKLGGKLTMTAIALKIVATALQKFPQFNASIDVARNEIVYKKSVHVGVAADTERGLLVPVIRDVDRKGVLQLAAELGAASEKARAGKLGLDDMQGAGFTVTNLGGIGGTSFTPIVNWPEVAILGMSRAAQEPVFINGQFQPRLMLPLSLSYDHRVIDGADAARFLRWVAEAFEQPFVMAL
ncbi:MAG TPA: 2-oxo acid dehydrogenase subunit E2 [Vicinamibacterales bacterium]|nr:2-oxo acid dehydrogenase subunit E2 [Vicinamibacterales bacterium]